MNLIFKKGYSKNDVATKYNVRYDTIKDWVKRFKLHGEYAFNPSHNSRKSFSIELKKQLVKDIINGNKYIKQSYLELNCDRHVLTD